MSDEEYLEYIHNNDRSKHQLTSGAHDRYCTQIIRDKEEILLSALNSTTVDTSSNRYRLGPSTNNIFKCLLDEDAAAKRGESVSLPSSPTQNRNFLGTENVVRRKSDTNTLTDTAMATATADRPDRANLDDEYILTLKIDDLTSDLRDVSFYRIGRNAGAAADNENDDDDDDEDDKYEFADDSITDLSQLSSCESSPSPIKTIDFTSNYVQCKQLENETAMRLRKLLIGSTSKPFPGQWLRQCFNFCHISASRWRLVQIKVGVRSHRARYLSDHAGMKSIIVISFHRLVRFVRRHRGRRSVSR